MHLRCEECFIECDNNACFMIMIMIMMMMLYEISKLSYARNELKPRGALTAVATSVNNLLR